MFVEEQRDGAPAEANRPTFVHAYSLNARPGQTSTLPSRVTCDASGAERRSLSGTLRGWRFTSGVTARAKKHVLYVGLLHLGFPGRCFTRAKFSPFTLHYLLLTTHHSRVTYRLGRGGTVNRPRTHVSHRKQTTEHMQGRNFPVHFLFPIFRQNPIALTLRRLAGRSLNSARRPTRSRLITRHLPFVPGTVTRVETHLSHRKQTTAHASTRNVPAHRNALHFGLRAPRPSHGSPSRSVHHDVGQPGRAVLLCWRFLPARRANFARWDRRRLVEARGGR